MKLIEIPITDFPGYENFSNIRHLLPELDLQNGPWIAGGALLRMITSKPFWGETEDGRYTGGELADIDFWFSNKDSYKNTIDTFRFLHKRPHETENAKTFKFIQENKLFALQCIHKRYYSNVEELLGSFDFTVAQIASDLNVILMPEYVMKDIQERTLKLATGNFNKGNFLQRVFKYTSNGYNPEPGLLGEISKMNRKELFAYLQHSIEMVDGYEFL
jgi:hypothetical protein